MVIYRTKKAKKIIDSLMKKNIQAVQYYRPICDNPPYASDNECPVSRKIYDECVYLPSSLTLKKEVIDEITKTIIEEEKS